MRTSLRTLLKRREKIKARQWMNLSVYMRRWLRRPWVKGGTARQRHRRWALHS